MADFTDVFQQPSVFIEEAFVGEEVAFDPGKGYGEIHLVEFRRSGFRATNGNGVTFPLAPRRSRLSLNRPVSVGEAPVVSGHQVALLFDRYGRYETLPSIGENH